MNNEQKTQRENEAPVLNEPEGLEPTAGATSFAKEPREENPAAFSEEASPAPDAGAKRKNVLSPDPVAKAAPPRKPVRRIGTVTLGVALIVTGVAALLSFFIPSFDVVFALKLSPLILVFLGIEILAQYFAHKGENLKYDLLSGFVCLLLIAVGLFGMAAPTLYEYYGPKRHELERRISAELEDACYEQLPDGSKVGFLQVNLRLGFRVLDEHMTYADLTAEDVVSVTVELTGANGSKEAFAAACRSTLDAIQRVDFRPETVHFTTYGESGRNMDLYVYNPSTNRLSAEELAERVSLYQYDTNEPEGYWEDTSCDPNSMSSYEETSEPETSWELVSTEAPIA